MKTKLKPVVAPSKKKTAKKAEPRKKSASKKLGKTQVDKATTIGNP